MQLLPHQTVIALNHLSPRSILVAIALGVLGACGGSDDSDDRKTIIPVECRDARGVIVPGSCD